MPEPLDRVLDLFRRPDVVPPGNFHHRLQVAIYGSSSGISVGKRDLTFPRKGVRGAVRVGQQA